MEPSPSNKCEIRRPCGPGLSRDASCTLLLDCNGCAQIFVIPAKAGIRNAERLSLGGRPRRHTAQGFALFRVGGRLALLGTSGPGADAERSGRGRVAIEALHELDAGGVARE